MRALTFQGFLKQYVNELSTGSAGGFYPLCREAVDQPRLREPLALYALYSGQTELILKATKDERVRNIYRSFFEQFDREKVERALYGDDESLPPEFRKVWKSYQSRLRRPRYEEETKRLMRKKILSLQQQKSVTNYRLYKDLSLNPGNINAWLKYGDGNKVGLETARSILRYIEKC